MADQETLDTLMEADGASEVPIPSPSPPLIENLVFRGGGVKGIAYCGALRVLSEFALLNNVKRHQRTH